MTPRRTALVQLLSSPLLLLFPPAATRAHAQSDPTFSPSTTHSMSGYHTQPGTHALPYRYSPPAGNNPRLRLAYWNEVALQAMAIDHALPIDPNLSPMPEQLGPTHTSRVMAIVQIAVYDALNAIVRRYPGYSGSLTALGDSSPDAAIAQASHDTLAALYPRQKAPLDALLKADLARLPAGRATLDGIDIGRRAAQAILALRAHDGSYQGEPVVGQDYFVSNAPGQWRPDPVSRNPIALGAYWYRVKPFVARPIPQYRSAPPPALTSAAYAQAFSEVKQVGGDGIHTPTSRTPEQTWIATFWAYDGTPWLASPIRMENQIAVQLALPRAPDALELARTLALVNAALADATTAVWDTKYYYDFWRPVTAIREASPGSGPTGRGDGNPDTRGDPGWTPLGSPASNLIGPNFTPPFPSYTSGHAGECGAMFQILRRLYGDAIAFTFMSDEWNGITRDNRGKVRPRAPRSYQTLSQAEDEAGQSRIYLGIHWHFDKVEGLAAGRRVANDVFQRGLVQPGT
jgi:hypothetical protein